MISKKVIILLLFITTLIISGCTQKDKREVIIFHAGSLSVPMKQIEEEFEKQHPYVDVLRESSGSRTAARKVSDLRKKSDIVASADYTVIYNLLIPMYADFCVNFATNEMVLMHRGDSKYSDEINGNNWYRVLLREDVHYGHSDPNKDPCGYRSQMVWQLAESHYNKKGLYGELKKKCPRKYVRPKETDLIALLESRVLDYIFIYRSVAVQHDMPFVTFPPRISLGDPDHTDFYNTAAIEVSGKKPGETISHRGKPIVYGLTLVKEPANRPDAVAFLKFMLGKEGQSIIDSAGQKPVTPPVTGEHDSLPDELKDIVKKNIK